MSKTENLSTPSASVEVQRRGALPVAPMQMPRQRLEWPRRRMSRLSLLSLALWGRTSRAGR